MTWAVASVWIALILSIGATACLGLWTLKTWIEWRFTNSIEVAKAMGSRLPPIFAGPHEPENFDLIGNDKVRRRVVDLVEAAAEPI